MNIQEYKKVKDYSYEEYCEYLKNKYGEAPCAYFNENWNKNAKISRTKDGLYCHHIREDRGIMLSTVEYAKNNPYEWQLPENLCYCDLLEHLFLHILICENPSAYKNEGEEVGIGGVIDFIVPELNDVYSGFKTKQSWRITRHEKIINDREAYFELLKRFRKGQMFTKFYSDDYLLTSFNEQYGLWSIQNNEDLYCEILNIFHNMDLEWLENSYSFDAQKVRFIRNKIGQLDSWVIGYALYLEKLIKEGDSVPSDLTLYSSLVFDEQTLGQFLKVLDILEYTLNETTINPSILAKYKSEVLNIIDSLLIKDWILGYLEEGREEIMNNYFGKDNIILETIKEQLIPDVSTDLRFS